MRLEVLRLALQGFSAAVDAIVQNLPPVRQTLLFSATQKQSVRSKYGISHTS